MGASTNNTGENASSTITAIIEKDQDEKLGINIGKKNNKVVITAITDGMPASKTNLRVNMEVLMVNNADVTNSSTEEILVLLTSTQGTLTIVAKQPTLKPGTLITAVITKEDPKDSVGIGLVDAGGDGDGGTKINSIKMDSPAFNTDLQTGMILKSVNNVDTTHKGPNDVLPLLQAAKGTFPILAQVPEELAVAQANPIPEQPAKTTTSRPPGQQGQRGPPGGLPEGGTWSEQAYAGTNTIIWFVMGCFCFGVFGPLALCCPCDKRDVYTVEGKVYASDGQFIGMASAGGGGGRRPPSGGGAGQPQKQPPANTGRVKD